MAYKKYFYKNGKKFGPYYYESYRDKKGKVKKRYIGTKDPDRKGPISGKLSKKINKFYKKNRLYFLFLLIGIFIFLLFYLRISGTGNAILDINEIPASYNIGDSINGSIHFEIPEGELIQKDTEIDITLLQNENPIMNHKTSMAEFLNMLEPVDIPKETISCENITNDETNETIENCTTSEYSDLYFNQAGIYSRNINDFISYTFNSDGNYSVLVDISNLSLSSRMNFIVNEVSNESNSQNENESNNESYNESNSQSENESYNKSKGKGFGTESNPGGIDSCQELNVSGNYILLANVSSVGTCFNITKDNITLDGNGKTILFNTGGTNNNSGILISGARKNITIENFAGINDSRGGSGNYQRGIMTDSDLDSSTIYNNTVYGSEGIGILGYSNSNNITYNNVTSYSGLGIFLLSDSTNDTISRNTISSKDSGIYFLSPSTGDTISGNNVTSSTSSGIYFNDITSSNIISGNNIPTDYEGISFFFYSINNTILDNNITSSTSYGIYFNYDSNYNNISFNNITTKTDGENAHETIYFSSTSSNDTILGNRMVSGWNGIFFITTSSNDTISGNTIVSENWGICLDESLSNKISYNNITAPDLGIYFTYYSTNNAVSSNIINSEWDGIEFDSSSTNDLLYNNSIISTKFDIYLGGWVNNLSLIDQIISDYKIVKLGNVTFINSSYGKISLFNMNGTGTNLIKNLSSDIRIAKNYAYVNSSKSGLNKSANIIFYTLPVFPMTPSILRDSQYVCNTTTSPSCYNFTSLNVHPVSFNVSSWSNYSIGIPRGSDFTQISDCGVLDTANTVYTQSADIVPTGSINSCINITASNITFDCNGHKITGSQNIIGVSIFNLKNITIRNCKISNFTTAIYISSANNSLFDNNTIFNNNGTYCGIYSYMGNNNIISNSNITNNNGNNNSAIYLYNSNFNIIENNTVENNTDFFDGGVGTITLYGGGIIGFVNNSYNNNFNNNILKSNNLTIVGATTGFYGGGIVGFYLNSDNNSLVNNTFLNNSVSLDSFIYGGGVLGVYNSSSNKFIDSNFTENNIKIYEIYGGGVFGFSTYFPIGHSYYNILNNSLFDRNNVISVTDISSGGGVLGFSELCDYNNIQYSLFIDNNVSVGGRIYGAGIFGLRYDVGTNISHSTFLRNHASADDVHGAGVFGQHDSPGFSNNTIINSTLINNTFYSNSYVRGGGLVGTRSVTGITFIDTIAINNNITIGGYMYGGGLMGFADNQQCSNNQFINNTVINNSVFVGSTLAGGGILGLFGCNSSNITNSYLERNNVTSSDFGIFGIYDTENDTISSMTIDLSLENLVYIDSNSDNNVFRDILLISNLKNNTFIKGTSINNTFLNASYNTTQEYVESGSQLIRKWYYRAYVNDTSGANVNNANVSAYSAKGATEFSGLMTNSSGWTNITEITDYDNKGGVRSYYSNYTINATKAGYENGSHSYNVSLVQNNNLEDVFTLGDLNEVSDCMVLHQPNTVYTQTADIVPSGIAYGGSCINITASNITFDCNGKSIYSITSNGTGIYAQNVNNITVKNCNVSMRGQDGTSNANGIGFYNVSGSFIINNTANSNNDTGIYLDSSSNNTLSNNTANSNSYGIYLHKCSNNNLTNNIANSNTYGINLDSPGSILIYNNMSNNTYNFNLNSVSNITIDLSNTVDYSYKIYYNYGLNNYDYGSLPDAGTIICANCNNVTVRDLNLSHKNYEGLYFFNTTNSRINNITANSNYYGIYLRYGSNNSLINNTANSNNWYGIYLSRISNNSIINNTANSNYVNGIYLELGLNNNFSLITTNSNRNGIGLGITSSNNTFTNIIANSNTINGIYLSDSNSNSFNNTGMQNCSGSGCIYIDGGSSNSFENLHINYSSGTGKGIELYSNTASSNSSDNLFKNVLIENIAGDNVYIWSQSGGFLLNNTFINCSYNLSKETFSGCSSTKCSLIRKWYYRAYVNDSFGRDVDDANVSAYNVSGANEFSGLMTNSSGWTNITTVTDYVNYGGESGVNRSYYSNYTLIAINGTLDSSHFFNSSLGNNLEDVFTLGESSNLFNESSEGNLTEWRMFGRFLNHSAWDGIGYYAIPGLNVAVFSTGNKITSSPVVANGYVYIGSTDGVFYQLNASNITQKISNYTVGVSIDSSSPTIANGYAYIGSIGGYIYQLNATNVTQQITSYHTPSNIFSSPIVANGYVYIGGNDHFFYQLNATNVSQQIANFSDGYTIHSSASVANGYVYFGSDHGILYQLNATNVSQQIAKFTAGGSIDSSPAVVNGYIYFGNNNNFYQLNATNVSQQIAIYIVGHIFDSSPAVVNSSVYVGCENGYLYQLNATNVSQQIANFSAGGSIDSSPAVVNGYVYFGSSDNNTYQLNASNVSQKIANYSTGNNIKSSPAVANGYVYFGSDDHNIYQLNASDISLGNSNTSQITNCTTITLPGVYTQIADIIPSGIASGGSCINITASNVTFDCNGKSIYSTNSNGTGIYAGDNLVNVNVKNCNVTMGNIHDNNGIYFNYVSNSFLINNTANSNSIGITIYNSLNNSLINNIANSNGNTGIYLWVSSNNSLINNTANFNIYGISLSSSSNNSIINSTANLNNNDGIYFYSGSNNIIKDSYIMNSTGRDFSIDAGDSSICSNTLTNVIGTDNKPIVYFNYSVNLQNWDNNVSEIVLCNADNSIINNVTMNHPNNRNNGILIIDTSKSNITNNNLSNLNDGISLYSNSNNNLLENNTANSNNHGIILDVHSSNNSIINNTANLNGMGIAIYHSSYNSLINNTVNLNGYGIFLYYVSPNNTIIGNSVNSNNQYGIAITWDSSNNYLAENTLNSNSDGIIFSGAGGIGSSNNIIKDTWINSTNYDVYSINDSNLNSINNTFINCSYNISKENVLSGSSLIRKWYYRAYVNDSGGANVGNANVSAYNVSGATEFSGLMTNSSGFTNITEITDYVNLGGVRGYYSDYTLIAINGTLSGSHSYNVSLVQNNNLKDVFTLYRVLPIVNITYPINGTNYNINVSRINYTTNILTGFCWYSNSSGIWNSTTKAAGQNFTNVISKQGSNTWRLYCNDSSGNLNSSSVSFTKDTIYPQFSNYWDNSGTLTGSGIARFNVSVVNTNGTVLLNINNANYSATNLSSNYYNVSLSMSSGNYNYSWISYGNGTNNNINYSELRNYTIGSVGGVNEDNGGGGGGGGGQTNLTNCTYNWTCTEWALGLDGNFTRNCTNNGTCTGELGKPNEFELYNIIDNTNINESNSTNEIDNEVTSRGGFWTCGEWSKCNPVYDLKDIIFEKVILDGEQERICKDNKNEFSQTDRRKCDTKIPITTKKVQKCNKNYLEIYDLNGNLIMRLELGNTEPNFLNIEITFDSEGNYCSYCYDKLKDFDEDEIDCSYSGDSSCPLCSQNIAQSKPDLLSNYYLILFLFLIFILFFIIIFMVINIRIKQAKLAKEEKKKNKASSLSKNNESKASSLSKNNENKASSLSKNNENSKIVKKPEVKSEDKKTGFIKRFFEKKSEGETPKIEKTEENNLEKSIVKKQEATPIVKSPEKTILKKSGEKISGADMKREKELQKLRKVWDS